MIYTKKAVEGTSSTAQTDRFSARLATGGASSLPQTPDSNTGYDSQNRGGSEPPIFSVAVDWLDFTFRSVAGANEAYALIEQLEAVLGESIAFSASHGSFHGRQWDGSGYGVDGTKIWYAAPFEDEFGCPQPAALKVALPGATLTPGRAAAIAQWLLVHRESTTIDCSRIDIALDDHDKFVKLSQISAARKRGNFFNCSYAAEIVSSNRGEIEGKSLYFGSPNSDKRLRIYDKTVESRGEIKGNRWEAQFRRAVANEVFALWLTAVEAGEDPTRRTLQNIVLGLVDFRKRGSDDNDRNRCMQLEWYVRLCQELCAKPARISIAAPYQAVQKTVNWVKKSVASSLAGLSLVLGDEFQQFVDEVIQQGGQRLSILRRELFTSANREALIY